MLSQTEIGTLSMIYVEVVLRDFHVYPKRSNKMTKIFLPDEVFG